MEYLKDFFEGIYELLVPLLKLIFMIAAIGFLVSALVFYTIQIDESKLNKIRYCPSCGIDLIQNG